jgi:hypothetical protein
LFAGIGAAGHGLGFEALRTIANMISHKYRCIFIHIPRTGGSSLEDLIWPEPRTEQELWMGFVSPYANRYQTGGLQHLSARNVRQVVGRDVFESYFKFSFVRNPWERAVSQYSYLARRADLRRLLGKPGGITFDDYLEKIAHIRHVQWEPQMEFLHDDNGDLIVDFIGRFENLENDAQVVLTRIGLPSRQLPHKQASAHGAYPGYYDSRARDRVHALYANDIQKLGYEFGR